MVKVKWTPRHLMPFLSWLPLLDRNTIRFDILAGITAGVLILPQAVALAAIAGLPAEYGIYTSIFPVVIAALFGSSYIVMSGPNTALAVMIFIDLSTFASRGTSEYITYAMGLTFMVGLFQLTFGLARLGVIFNFISHSVILGLTSGVGVVIIVQQLGNFLGLLTNQREEIYETLLQIFYNFDHVNWATASCGIVTVASGLLIRRHNRRWPHLVLAVVIGTAFGFLVDSYLGSANANIDKLGALSLAAIPFAPVDFSEDSQGIYRELILSAMLIGFLGLMQSAVIARQMAVRTGQHIDMNQEIVGQGLSNLVGSYLSCFASCGSFNRSAANLDAGARTPLASLVSAVVLALLIALASPWIALMPISVMAGVLLLVGWGLIDMNEIRKLYPVRSEFVIFIVCFISSFTLGLDYGVAIGVLMSVVDYFSKVSKPVISRMDKRVVEAYVPDSVTADATILCLNGNLFFGSVQSVQQQLRKEAERDDRHSHLFLMLEAVSYLDTVGAQMLAKEATRRHQAGSRMYLGLRNHHLDDILEKSGLAEAIGTDNIFYRSRAAEAVSAPFTQTPIKEIPDAPPA